MTSALIATLFLGSDGIGVLPLVIVAVVISFVLTIWLAGAPSTTERATTPQAAADHAAPTQVR
jgi:hypothetical protein